MGGKGIYIAKLIGTDEKDNAKEIRNEIEKNCDTQKQADTVQYWVNDPLPTEPVWFYLCDRKACINCNPKCKHTSDISHAIHYGKTKNIDIDFIKVGIGVNENGDAFYYYLEKGE